MHVLSFFLALISFQQPVGFPWLEQKVTEWGCMQALIDFDGWRKWRGFQDSPRSSSPSFDSAASPMQMGGRTDSSQPTEPASPSVARTASKGQDARVKRPHLPSAKEVMRENSWGSGSGGDTGDSASPQETPKSAPEQANGA